LEIHELTGEKSLKYIVSKLFSLKGDSLNNGSFVMLFERYCTNGLGECHLWQNLLRKVNLFFDHLNISSQTPF
jgi:hypothetical protein